MENDGKLKREVPASELEGKIKVLTVRIEEIDKNIERETKKKTEIEERRSALQAELNQTQKG